MCFDTYQTDCAGKNYQKNEPFKSLMFDDIIHNPPAFGPSCKTWAFRYADTLTTKQNKLFSQIKLKYYTK